MQARLYKNVTGQFLLVILQVKVDKTCHMGGGGVLKVRKKCHVLFEWPLMTKEDGSCSLNSEKRMDVRIASYYIKEKM